MCVTGKVASQRVIMWMLRLQLNKVDTYKLCEGLGQSGRPHILKEIDAHSTELLHTVSTHLSTLCLLSLSHGSHAHCMHTCISMHTPTSDTSGAHTIVVLSAIFA
jgi:hypothetical protein